MKKALGSVVLGTFVGSLLLANFLTPARKFADPSPDIVMESLDPTVLPYENLWATEITRRFHGAVGVIVHGGDFVEGQWVVGTSWQPWKHITPVEEVLTHFEHLYPDRTIVLVSCNPGHVHLHGHPRVWYALDSVWVFPDRAMGKETEAGAKFRTIDNNLWAAILADNDQNRWTKFPTIVGSIFEFVNAGE